jgi:septum formation protein
MKCEKIVLASASPRRQELLTQVKIPFIVDVADIDETPLSGENAENMVGRLSEAKARAVISRQENIWILGADTAVIVDNMIFGKPTNREEARNMLATLSGRIHEVISGFTLVNSATDKIYRYIGISEVEFATITESNILWYLNSEEGKDKAGSYAFQGLGAHFIRTIRGSYTNVIGLDVSAVYSALESLEVLKW